VGIQVKVVHPPALSPPRLLAWDHGLNNIIHTFNSAGLMLPMVSLDHGMKASWTSSGRVFGLDGVDVNSLQEDLVMLIYKDMMAMPP